MSDVMLLGVLRMPWDTKGDLELIQIQSRMHQAADRIEADRDRIADLEAKLARYTRLSESGESLGGELDEREKRMELEAKLAEAIKHARHLMGLAVCADEDGSNRRLVDEHCEECQEADAWLATKESEARTLAQANADNERELLDRIAELETELAEVRAEFRRAGASAQEVINNLTDENDKLEARLEESKAQLAESRVRIKQLENGYDTLKGQAGKLKAKLAEAESHLSQAIKFISCTYANATGILQCGNDKDTAFDIDAAIAAIDKAITNTHETGS